MEEKLKEIFNKYNINFNKISKYECLMKKMYYKIDNVDNFLEMLFNEVYPEDRYMLLKAIEKHPSILIKNQKVFKKNVNILKRIYENNVELNLVRKHCVDEKFNLKIYFEYLSIFTIPSNYFLEKIIYIGENYGFFTFYEDPACMIVSLKDIKEAEAYFENTVFTFPEIINILISGEKSIRVNIETNLNILRNAYYNNIPINYSLFGCKEIMSETKLCK